jgi:23S rRNA pseudouridine2605 synthase
MERDEKPIRGKRPAFGEDKPATRKPGKFSKNKPSAHVKSTRKGAEKNYKGSRRTHENTGRDLENANLLTGEEVRLNRYIANSGICSRREADVMIEQGLVQLNGKVVTELGQKVNPGDEVKVDGRRITPEKPVYILLNKPKGYITSTVDPDGRATVIDLIDLPGKERIYPIGRLDRNTTGVLLLTNDGELAQKIMHPSFEIKKVYRATLDRKPSKDHMLAWVSGIELEDGFMAFEQCGFVEKEEENTLGVEIHSGRNRIVRRMFEHFGYEVKNLDRVLLGEFDHLKLGRGKWRFLNEKEQRYVERIKRSNAPKRKK